MRAVGTSGFGGAVGVENKLPAAAVDAHVMVILTNQSTILDRSFAADLLVSQVVHVAVDRGAAAPGPGAGAVAEQDGTADVRGDGVGVADV
jgi:hypothetical protein